MENMRLPSEFSALFQRFFSLNVKLNPKSKLLIVGASC